MTSNPDPKDVQLMPIRKRMMVDMLHACIERAEFTPTEIREAAMLAQIMYEDTHIRPHTFTRDDVMKGRV